MHNSHVRIKIDGNASYLIYQRGHVQEIVGISLVPDHALHRHRQGCGLAMAWRLLRNQIQDNRFKERNQDILALKRSGTVLRLMEEKRKHFIKECLREKHPLTDHRYVGVEIEFLSNSAQKNIAESLAKAGLSPYVELKCDGSVGREIECDGSCREDCTCADCGETHYCDSETECNRRARNYGGDGWEYRDDCDECTDTEEWDGCDCGGTNEETGETICEGNHIVCSGHCPGHGCLGGCDHEDYECSCECNCSPNGDGHEIAIVAKSTVIAEIIRKVCAVLKTHDAEVNDTCGLHVHLDARKENEELMFTNLVNAQKLLYNMVPRSRWTSQYCRPNNYETDMGSYHSRYYGINPESYGRHKTIEVRLHSGSVNAEKINKWIILLKKIAYSKNAIKKVDHINDLTSHVKLSYKTLTYIKERVEKFKGDHRDHAINIDISEDMPIAA